ncbi:potassium channel family protein [Synoicihabitans lomoniglobus]|uniref:Potassium channel family protein n=1 Tax=Synoicihabitans lomoniglobus TaxID=2909285 RepID=A0AAF0CSJ0_9BACT|nr:potassium channel family protein [Opitutaceae bacterium LMO-M01]WED67241.1 potassium channel family protein [Opitutaceae bacterium LMO-M01]
MTTVVNPPTDPRHLGRFFYLLLSICAMLVLLPIADQFPKGVPLLMCGVYATMWFAIHAVSGDRRKLLTAIALGLPVLVLQLLAAFVGGELSRRGFIFTWLAMPLFVAFWFYITLAILRAFVAADVFTRDKLCGAICVFLLIGITWATLYLWLQHVSPGAFFLALPGDPILETITPTQAIYFSYLTMSTMGYGDIIPGNDLVRTAAYAQAVAGVLFLSVFIARVVSLYDRHHESHCTKG